MMTIDPARASIVEAVLLQPLFTDGCEVHFFEGLQGKKLYQGVFKPVQDKNLSVVMSLPADTGNTMFIALADRAVPMVRRIVANLEEWSSEGNVSLGNIVLIENQELQASGYCGVILLPVSVSTILEALPETIKVRDALYPVMLVVPVSDAEHQVWKSHGHDALMSFLDDTQKQIVFEQVV
ncbi:MAG: hypothetical protein ACK59M_01105 [Pseudomonadota bacterium]|jgi:hypothetical protein